MKNKPDWILILLYLLLMAIGWVSIFFTTYQQGDFEINTSYGMQLIWAVSSALLGVFVYIISKRFYYNFAAYIYVLFVFLILLVIFVGVEKSGAKSWLGIGRFGIQPAEVAKYATCLLLARYVSMRSVNLSYWKNALGAAIIVGIPVLLILLQNDTGTAIPLLFLVFALFREGLTSWILVFGFLALGLFAYLIFFPQWIVILLIIFIFTVLFVRFRKQKSSKIWQLVVVCASIVLYTFTADLIYHKALQPHQRQRIDLLFGKIDDEKGIGYHTNQSKIAIGSGGLYGKGFGEGTQTKLNFVPEQSTDYIFCTIGEEHGFVGATGVVLLYFLLLWRIIHRAEKSNDTFIRCYGYCIASVFFAHFAINIGMTIGLMPVIGIPLPFISYGGSSLWAFTLMLFTFINLESHNTNKNWK
jgi:rod shape determining protein RodA